MSTVAIDSEELQALRVLAKRALELTGSRPRRPRPDPDRLTHQELNLVQRLIEARGETVPPDRLIRHVATTGVHAVTDEWNRNPATTITFARRKLRETLGSECIETVWPTRVNRRGHVVRDLNAGILGYRWAGPDIAGMALATIADLGLSAVSPGGDN